MLSSSFDLILKEFRRNKTVRTKKYINHAESARIFPFLEVG